MVLIVGLGNPGKKYSLTRHNVGFIALDTLVEELQLGSWEKFSNWSLIIKTKVKTQDIILVKPQTFMNDSGTSVREVMQFYHMSASDLWVVHDDLDLAPMKIRLSENASSAGHNGVQSIIDAIGTKDFKRFRFGIGKPQAQQPTEGYVLGKLSPDELTAAETTLAELVRIALEDGFGKACSRVNQ